MAATVRTTRHLESRARPAPRARTKARPALVNVRASVTTAPASSGGRRSNGTSPARHSRPTFRPILVASGTRLPRAGRCGFHIGGCHVLRRETEGLDDRRQLATCLDLREPGVVGLAQIVVLLAEAHRSIADGRLAILADWLFAQGDILKVRVCRLLQEVADRE